MKRSGGTLTWSIFLLIIAVDLLNGLAELCFKKGATAPQIHPVTLSNLPEFGLGLLSSGWLWIGILCYLLMFMLWMTVLSRIDLSVAFLILSMDYLLVPFFSVLFLRESVPLLRWAGIGSIVVGICLTSWSSASQSQGNSRP